MVFKDVPGSGWILCPAALHPGWLCDYNNVLLWLGPSFEMLECPFRRWVLAEPYSQCDALQLEYLAGRLEMRSFLYVLPEVDPSLPSPPPRLRLGCFYAMMGPEPMLNAKSKVSSEYQSALFSLIGQVPFETVLQETCRGGIWRCEVRLLLWPSFMCCAF